MILTTVTVCFNSAATIRHTVESFLEQDYPAKRMLVIDGASCDDTVAIVKTFGSPLISVISEPDAGLYDAMSKGLRLFDGDALGFLNSDDRYHDRFAMSAIADGLISHPIVHGGLRIVDSHGGGPTEPKTLRRWKATPRPVNGFKSGWMPSHPTFYVRRDIAERVGPFDQTLGLSADYDWMLRAVELGDQKIGVIDRLLVDMLAGGASTSGLGAYIEGNLGSLRSRQRWLGSGVIDRALFLKPLRKLGQWV